MFIKVDYNIYHCNTFFTDSSEEYPLHIMHTHTTLHTGFHGADVNKATGQQPRTTGCHIFSKGGRKEASSNCNYQHGQTNMKGDSDKSIYVKKSISEMPLKDM